MISPDGNTIFAGWPEMESGYSYFLDYSGNIVKLPAASRGEFCKGFVKLKMIRTFLEKIIIKSDEFSS
jgi:hypothetical protein